MKHIPLPRVTVTCETCGNVREIAVQTSIARRHAAKQVCKVCMPRPLKDGWSLYCTTHKLRYKSESPDGKCPHCLNGVHAGKVKYICLCGREHWITAKSLKARQRIGRMYCSFCRPIQKGGKPKQVKPKKSKFVKFNPHQLKRCRICGKLIRHEPWKSYHDECLAKHERDLSQIDSLEHMKIAADIASARIKSELNAKVEHIPIEQYLAETGRSLTEPIPKPMAAISWVERSV